jgi:hypothetical protein
MATVPITPGQIIWHFLGPNLDPFAHAWLPEDYHRSYDVLKFMNMVFADAMFGQLAIKFLFHESYTLTFVQDLRMRMYYRSWTSVSLPAIAMVTTATVLGTLSAYEMHRDSTPLSKIASLGSLPIARPSRRGKIASLGGF